MGELDFVYKLFQPTVRPRIEEFIKKRKIKGPLIVEFDPTTICNFVCPECVNRDLLNRGEIHPRRVLELIDEFYNTGVMGIIFIGGGEPLEHTGMPQPIIHAYKLGMMLGLTTNGSLIDKYLEVIAGCVNWVRFSIDAATQETFSLFKTSRTMFTKVISNIECLAKIKKGRIGYSFLLIEKVENNGNITTNCHEIFQAAVLARDIGCDYFEFKPSVNEHHYLIPLSQKTKALLQEQINKLKELNTNYFSVIAPKSIDHLLTSNSLAQPKTYTSCPTVELRTVVTPNGVYPCPYKRGLQKNWLGSVNVKFDKFWFSEERLVRTNQINPSIDCPFYCIRHHLNILLEAISKLYTEGIDLFQYLTQAKTTNDIFI
jgi:MoaA/NifB/PqqE/SkfB family radical SAM enzyme